MKSFMGDLNESTIMILSSLSMMCNIKSDVRNKSNKTTEELRDTILLDKYENLPETTIFAIQTSAANDRVTNGFRN